MTDRLLVIYYRVSTQQQKRSGLGLLAQQRPLRDNRYHGRSSCKNMSSEVESWLTENRVYMGKN